MTTGVLLALVPVCLAAGGLVVFLIPRRLRAWPRVATLGAITIAICLLLYAVGAAASGKVEIALRDAVPGVALIVRGDPVGISVVLMAMVGALGVALRPDVHPVMLAGLLIALLGTTVAGLAGNAVLLFGGVECGAIGSLVVMSAAQRRVGRGAAACFVAQHAAALGVLWAAVQLQTSDGTSDFAAIPVGGVGLWSSLPWGLGAAILLLTPLISSVAHRGVGIAWMAVAPFPGALVALVRLADANGSAGLPDGTAVALVVAGGLITVAAAAIAAVASGRRWIVGRALCVASAGPLVIMIGLASVTPSARIAGAAVAITAELSLIASPLWDEPSSRGWAAWGLALASPVPVGFGATATVLVTATVLAPGRPIALLVLPIGVSAAVCTVAAARAALSVLTSARPAPAVRRVPAVAAVVAIGAGILPGAVLRGLGSRLSSGAGGVTVIDGLSVRAPGGGLAGGYISLALLAAGALVASAGRLLGWSMAPISAVTPPGDRPALWHVLRRGRRRAAPVIRRIVAILRSIDSWLVDQPRLSLVVGCALAALWIVR